MVRIKLILSGLFSEKKQSRELELEIRGDLGDVITKIDQIIVKRKGSKIPYTILINNINYSIMGKNTNMILKNGDVVTAVPIVSGG